MHIHIVGICGTFMGGIAAIARSAGHRVTGCDANVYPPMSTQLAALGIEAIEGYAADQVRIAPDVFLIGNVITRGNPLMEEILDRGLPYVSGPQWLAKQVLQGKWVAAVAGTHGKTTTASMLAWILEYAGLAPGFLIGGVPENFGISARLAPSSRPQGDGMGIPSSSEGNGEGGSAFFVIEADEYDTAFFDKRSKFIHYPARVAILNNLEFDHADIFPDLDAIKRQFHHMVRTVPGTGLLVVNGEDRNVDDVLSQGCWTPIERFDDPRGWQAQPAVPDCSRFGVYWQGQPQGEVAWKLLGRHNMYNALAAIAAGRHAGVPVSTALSALSTFQNVKRRLEVRGNERGVTVYDDFAHHPTAITLTLQALRARVGDARVVAVLEARSNTMRMGVHRDTLAASLADADLVLLYDPPGLGWDMAPVRSDLGDKASTFATVDAMVSALAADLKSGDHVLIMSNGAFDGIHGKLLERLKVD